MRDLMRGRVDRIRLALTLSLLAGSVACVPMSMEQHGGLAPIPSKVPDVGFVAIGALTDQALISLKLPVIPRLAADAVAAWSIRNVSTFGRSVDSGFLFVLGVYPPEFVRFVTHAGQHNRAHPCPTCWPATYWARRDSLARVRDSLSVRR